MHATLGIKEVWLCAHMKTHVDIPLIPHTMFMHHTICIYHQQGIPAAEDKHPTPTGKPLPLTQTDVDDANAPATQPDLQDTLIPAVYAPAVPALPRAPSGVGDVPLLPRCVLVGCVGMCWDL